MSKYSGVVLATEEDLERDFPDGFVIGIPVRPPDYTPPKDEVEEPEQDEA